MPTVTPQPPMPQELSPAQGVNPEQVTAPEVPVTEPAPKSDDATRFAQLARREKMLRARARDLEQREAAIKAVETQKPQAPDMSWKAKLDEDPITFLTENGYSYDQITQILLNQNPLDPQVKLLKKELQAIRDDQQKVLTQVQEQQNNSYQQALNQIKVEARNLIKGNAEEYEALNKAGEVAENAIVKLIEETWKQDQYMMDVSEAAKAVEDYYLEQALEFAKLNKIKARLTPTQEAATKETPIPSTPVKQPAQATTLSHNMAPMSKGTTSKERRERAILAFQGKLTT